jgi:Rnl2 family RNA ligase
MDFIGFPSIDNDPKPQKMDTQGNWIATEKADGANFGIYLDLGNIRGLEWIKCAKRTGFLTPGDEKQFPIDEWLAANRANLEQIARNIVVHLGEIILGTYAIIYGEFYGGFFPANPAAWQGSKSLPAEMKAYADANDGAKPKPVQRRTYYAHDYHFICFDILVVIPDFKPVRPDGRPVLASEVVRHMNWLPNVFVRAQPIPHVPVMFSGTFAECLEWANSDAKHVNSAIPHQIHGLPVLAPGTNIIEGVVLSPVSGPHFTYKIKNPEFQEKKTAQTPRHTPRHIPRHTPKDTPRHIPKDTPTTHPFLDYITTNRWFAVRSKYGVITRMELIAAFEADALEDYLKDNPGAKTPNLGAKYMRRDLDAFYAELTDLDESILC